MRALAVFSFWKRHNAFPIGVDLSADGVKVAQLGRDEQGIFLVSAASEKVPDGLEVGSGQWQRWVVGVLRRLMSEHKFEGREVVTALPPTEVFIEQVKVPNRPGQNLDEVVLNNIRNKLSFSADDALVKHMVTREGAGLQAAVGFFGKDSKGAGGSDVLVMATERVKVDRHLAIYENARLQVKQIAVWPIALANSYAKFFGRRQTDSERVVMLIQVGVNHTNVSICRGRDVLFARLIPMGLTNGGGEEMANRLVLELSACEHYFESLSGANRIERLIYLSSQNADKGICDNLAQLAQRRHIPAQLANVLGAVGIRAGVSNGFDRRNCKVDWSLAFGLSLS